MSRLVRRYSWKFVGLVGILAVLTFLAPAAWRRLTPPKGAAPVIAAAPAAPDFSSVPSEAPPAAPAFTPAMPVSDSETHLAVHAVAAHSVVDDASRLPNFELPELPVVEEELTPATLPELRTPETADLSEFETPKQVAPTGPLVAEHIDHDPSLSQVPTRMVPKFVPDVEIERAQPETTPSTEPGAPPATPAEASPSLLPPSPGVPTPETPSPVEPRPLPDEANLPNQSTVKPQIKPDVPPPPENASAGAWPYPTALIAQLRDLQTKSPEAMNWAERTIVELETLAQVRELNDPNVSPLLDRLYQLSLQAKELAAPLKEDNDRSRILRAGYAVNRRIAVWQLAHAAAVESSGRVIATPSTGEWHACLDELNRQLRSLPGGAPWITYLRLTEARQKIGSPDTSAADRRALARDILRRLHSTQFNAQQGEFAESPVFFDLIKRLKQWADEPVDLAGVLQAIEEYERQDLTAESTAVARFYQQIRWSPDKRLAELGDTINMYYRNANIRVAFSAQLINRFLPKEARQAEYVQDIIQGAYVEGNSQASTRLRLVLLPDRLRWRVGLEAQGEVASDTASTKGPATFYQNGLSQYRVRKMLLVDRRGVRMFNSEAEAYANTNLLDYETSFDNIPIFGSLARMIARDQYEAAQDAARMEVEGKIRGKASSRVDQAVAEQLRKGQANFNEKLLEPMRRLSLEPTAVDMETTNDRLIARYRLAAHEQLSAHTPRPQAPADSLLSVQVHETALNNIIQQLQLGGRRLELRELHKEVTSIFTKTPPPPPDDLPEDVYVTFMEDDPVRIDCDQGRVRLTIRIEQLEHGKSKWRNFTVRGYYAPSADQLDANLSRDGVIELIGERLRVGDQIALRGIFSRVLSRNRQLNLINKQLALAPELQDQQVTQLVIHDGWIGVALGPRHPQRETIGLRRKPATDDAEQR
jgi:hypothetical protein